MMNITATQAKLMDIKNIKAKWYMQGIGSTPSSLKA